MRGWRGCWGRTRRARHYPAKVCGGAAPYMVILASLPEQFDELARDAFELKKLLPEPTRLHGGLRTPLCRA